MKELYIIGAGGFGREVAWLAERINEAAPTWEIKGFVDDNTVLHGTTEDDYPVLGGCDVLGAVDHEVWVVCAVGSARVRKKIIEKLGQYGNVRFATLIDPNVQMSKRVEIGEGCIICAGTIITVDVSIGCHTIINLDCTIGHDAVLEDYVTLYPSANISGNVVLGEGVEIGTGTHIIQGKTVGRGSVVGAGAVVVKDLPAKCTAVGSPAKAIKFFEE